MESPQPALLLRVLGNDLSAREQIGRLVAQFGYPHIGYATVQRLVADDDPQTSGCVIAVHLLFENDGYDVCERLAAQGVQLPVIVIGHRGEVSAIVEVMRSGAIDFIEQPVSAERLALAIKRALQVDAAWRERRRRRATLEARLKRLTPREHDVMRLVVAGMGNKQIAAALSRSEKTVEIHRAKAMKKMEAASLAALVTLINEYDQVTSEWTQRRSHPE